MKNFVVAFILLFFMGCASKGNIGTTKSSYSKSASVFLKAKFILGDTTYYNQETYMDMPINLGGGMSFPFDMTMESKNLYIVTDTGEVTKIDVIFDKMATSGGIDGMHTYKEMDEFTGKKITLSIDRNGKTSKVEGMEDLFSNTTFKSFPANDTKEQFSSQFGFFPQKEVKINDTWTKESEGEKTTYTLMNFEKKQGFDCAKISVKEEINTTTPIDMVQKGIHLKGKLSLKGVSNGYTWFAIKEGKLVESKISTSLEGEQEIKNESTGNIVKAPINVNLTITTKISSK
ncbi:MAG: DUF6263 family protein [bacterium]|nr:DUF6263 family protein [bacterium]